MRTRIVLACTALYVSCIAASAGQSQDGSQDRLYSSIRANDLRQIKTLLDEGISAKAEGPDGITPLMVAAETGSPDAMKMLIDRGADVNARNTYGSTALMWSVTDLKKLRLLLDPRRRRQCGGAKRTYGSDHRIICESVSRSRAHAARKGGERGRDGSEEGSSIERRDVRQRHCNSPAAARRVR